MVLTKLSKIKTRKKAIFFFNFYIFLNEKCLKMFELISLFTNLSLKLEIINFILEFIIYDANS